MKNSTKCIVGGIWGAICGVILSINGIYVSSWHFWVILIPLTLVFTLIVEF